MPPPADVPAGQVRQGLGVGLLIRSEVIRSGLEVLLRRLDRVTTIRSFEPSSAPEVLGSPDVDVLMVTIGERTLVRDAWETYGGAKPRVLVLGDNLHENVSHALVPPLPADGFLSLADLSADVLDDTLDRMCSGEIPMPAALARRLLTAHHTAVPGTKARTAALTTREHETLTLLSDGLSNKQIAALLGISPHGTKRLVTAVLLKLGAPNRTAAVVTAIKLGLVSGASA